MEQDFNNEELDNEGIEPPPQEAPKNYEDLAIEEPEREVKLENLEVSKEDAGIDESDQVAKTDFQSALAAITPKFVNKRMDAILQPVMKSRVFPDNYLDLNYLLTMMLIEEQEGKDDIDFLEIVTGAQVATSVAYEGKHIIDVSEMYGAANEQEMDKLSKDILGS